MGDYEYLQVLSVVVGWIYFVSWSLSFYPQALLNYQKKSVAGFSIDFALMNVCGFFFYSLYWVGGHIYPHMGTGVVQINDMVFALNSFLISGIHLTQTFIYESGTQNRFSPWVINMLIIEWTVILTIFGLEGLAGVSGIPTSLNAFKMAGYSKAIITMLKYAPQVYLNYCRKSTAGWSIHMILCDFSGGFFSTFQQIIDTLHNSLSQGTWNVFSSSSDSFNLVKCLLGLITIIFDLIFILQHYVLYRNRKEPTKEKEHMELRNTHDEPLLNGQSRDSSLASNSPTRKQTPDHNFRKLNLIEI